MNLLYGADEYVARWVEQRISHCKFDKYVAIGVMDGARILAGVVYHNYLPDYGNIEMSIAADSPAWATRKTLRGLFAYPFIQLGCQRVTATIPARNEKSRSLTARLGFIEEGCLRRGYGNDDLIVTGLLREEAEKWIKEK